MTIEATVTTQPTPLLRNSRALWERLGEIKDHVFSPSEDPTDAERVVKLMGAAARIQEAILDRIHPDGGDEGVVRTGIGDAEIAVKALRTVAQQLAGEVEEY